MLSLPLAAPLAAAALALAACTTGSAPSPKGDALEPPTRTTSAADPSSANPTSTAQPPVGTEQPLPDISGLARWCPGCVSGGDTTDFGGGPPPPPPPGCTYWVTTQTTVSEALARNADLSTLPVGLNERFETDVHWREQGRSSRITVTARLNESIRLAEAFALDAGSDQSCAVLQAIGSVHVTLDSDDGSIAGEIEAQPLHPHAIWPEHDRKLGIISDWGPAIQLRGNLQLSPLHGGIPERLTFQLVWYRIPEIPADRIGIGITAHYQTSAADPYDASLSQESLAMAVPSDDCLPWQLSSGGLCVELADHPLYGAPPPVDAGVAEPYDAGF
jgi:hypothetical protein